MIKILVILLVILSLTVSGDQAAKSPAAAAMNILIFCAVVELSHIGANILVCSLIGSVLISAVTIFYQNEGGEKTTIAFISVMIVLACSLIFILWIVQKAHLQGFDTLGDAKIVESNGYSSDIRINMYLAQVGAFLIVLLGAVIDAAVAISSGVYEVSRHSVNAAPRELFKSGMNIGKDILNSNVNTLFFIFAGEYMISFINYLSFYSVETMLNSKSFAQDSISIMVSALGSIIVIPISAALAASRYGAKAG